MTLIFDGLTTSTSGQARIEAEIAEIADLRHPTDSDTLRGYLNALIVERQVWLTWQLWTHDRPIRYLRNVLGVSIAAEMALTPTPPEA